MTATCLERFGSRRCMWGSNLPIESLWTDLPTLVTAWKRALGGVAPDVRRDVFAGTVRRVYALADD